MSHRGAATGTGKGWTGLAAGAYVAYQVSGHGPAAKDVVIGKALNKLRNAQRIELQPYRGVWYLVRFCHLPLFIGFEGEATTESTSTIMKDSIAYSALVLQVELLAGGELTHGSARTLLDRGWVAQG